MTDSPADVLIVGASARGLAESAAIAGCRVLAIDAYGDLDLRARVRTVALPRDLGIPYTAARAARAAAAYDAATVAYTSGFENHPGAITALARQRTLLGNPAIRVRAARDPVRMADALRERGFAVADVVTARHGVVPSDGRDWVEKPLRSGGGHGVREARPRARVVRGRYLQERIRGEPGSVVFVADGRRVVPLGVSRQLVGDPAFGGRGFRYTGSLLAGAAPVFDKEAELLVAAGRLAAAVTAVFGLVGLNGVDFIARDGIPWPIEINPRFTASMELVERAHGISMFALHAQACTGLLPGFASLLDRRIGAVWGKAIVYARKNETMREIRRWWRSDAVRDVPHAGERIPRGRPICTLLAAAPTPESCRQSLARHAAEIYASGVLPDRSVA
jgi:uncharacterized protein